jgi:hypothetical protein
VEATKQKEEKRKKPKPEEQEGMPQRRHCPSASGECVVHVPQKVGIFGASKQTADLSNLY